MCSVRTTGWLKQVIHTPTKQKVLKRNFEDKKNNHLIDYFEEAC
jgi:hypothetical protein